MQAFGSTVGLVLLAFLSLTPQRGASQGPMNAAELAAFTAAQGWSAGIVSVLAAPESVGLSRMKGRKGYEFSSNGFRVFMRTLRRGPGELDKSTPEMHSAASAFEEFARGHSDFSPERTARGIDLLRHKGAGFCSAVLRKRLPDSVESKEIHDLMARIIHGATGAKVPGGFIASCVGDNEVSASPLFVSKGETVQAAFDQVVAAFGGAVWVAVQTDDKGCSVGLVLRSTTPETVCLSTIAAEIN